MRAMRKSFTCANALPRRRGDRRRALDVKRRRTRDDDEREENDDGRDADENLGDHDCTFPSAAYAGISQIGRISLSPTLTTERKRLPHSIASAIDFTCIRQ